MIPIRLALEFFADWLALSALFLALNHAPHRHGAAPKPKRKRDMKATQREAGWRE